METAIEKSTGQEMARIHVFATSGEEMVRASAELLAWFSRKVDAEKAVLKQIEENLELAKENKWNTAGWKAALSRAKGAVAYYEKAKAAVEAGYTIVPDLNADWFALRTTKSAPNRNETSNHYHEPAENSVSLPPAPLGQGEYVSNVVAGKFREYKNEKGEQRFTSWDTEFKEVVFPVMFVRPELVDATAEAMRLKIFDAIGIVDQGRSDPLIVGVVNGPRQGWTRKRMHFIIGWFLDTRTL